MLETEVRLVLFRTMAAICAILYSYQSTVMDMEHLRQRVMCLSVVNFIHDYPHLLPVAGLTLSSP